MTKKHLNIATRKSKLALWQANFVKSALENHYPDLSVSLVGIVTEGDLHQHTALSEVGGKALFVKALQNALLNDEADIAVHSIKDMSVHPTSNLLLAAICERADPRDAFLSVNYSTIESLPPGAIVGTSSPRRHSLIKSMRPDIQTQLLRGNVDTRLSKLDNKQFDAIILAAAGLSRLGLADRISQYLPIELFTPAIGQGAIGIECRENDDFSREILQFLNHLPTAHCVMAERAVNQVLGGDCYASVGAYANIQNGKLQLSAMVSDQDGTHVLRAHATGDADNAVKIGESVAQDLLQQGAAAYLD